MRNINQIFKNNTYLKDEPEVAELIEYCMELEGEVLNKRLSNTATMESKLAFLVRDIYGSVAESIKLQENKERFNIGEDIDFRVGTENLKKYLEGFSRDENFNLYK
jgi:hypothetical protein